MAGKLLCSAFDLEVGELLFVEKGEQLMLKTGIGVTIDAKQDVKIYQDKIVASNVPTCRIDILELFLWLDPAWDFGPIVSDPESSRRSVDQIDCWNLARYELIGKDKLLVHENQLLVFKCLCRAFGVPGVREVG